MLKKINNQKGVTLLILVIMIIVMLIIAGITIYSGTEAIQRAGLENLKTNLLLIEAKTKEYVEEVSFKREQNQMNLKEQKLGKRFMKQKES